MTSVHESRPIMEFDTHTHTQRISRSNTGSQNGRCSPIGNGDDESMIYLTTQIKSVKDHNNLHEQNISTVNDSSLSSVSSTFCKQQSSVHIHSMKAANAKCTFSLGNYSPSINMQSTSNVPHCYLYMEKSQIATKKNYGSDEDSDSSKTHKNAQFNSRRKTVEKISTLSNKYLTNNEQLQNSNGKNLSITTKRYEGVLQVSPDSDKYWSRAECKIGRWKQCPSLSRVPVWRTLCVMLVLLVGSTLARTTQGKA